MMLLYSTTRALARTTAPCPAAPFSRVSQSSIHFYESTSIGSRRPYTSTPTFQPLTHGTQPSSRVCHPVPFAVRAYGSDGKGEYSGGVSLVQGASRGIGLEFVSMILYTFCSKFLQKVSFVYESMLFTHTFIQNANLHLFTWSRPLRDRQAPPSSCDP